MKVETTEHSVRLMPETPYEISALKKIYKSGVDKVRFENGWNLNGYLELVLDEHRWGR